MTFQFQSLSGKRRKKRRNKLLTCFLPRGERIEAKIIVNLKRIATVDGRNRDELLKNIEQEVSGIVKEQNVVKCDASKGSVRFASPDIVPPFAVLILDSDEKKALSIKKRSVNVEIDNEKVRLRLPIFSTPFREIYNNEDVYKLLIILGDLHKHIFVTRVTRPEYIWEHSVIYDEEDFRLLLKSVPEKVKRVLEEALLKSSCHPREGPYFGQILINPFFPIRPFEADKKVLSELSDWMFYSSSDFIHSSRLSRYFELIKGIAKGEAPFEKVSLAVNILKRTLRIAKFLVSHANDLSRLFEFTLSQLSFPSTQAFVEFNKNVVAEYIYLQDDLSLAEKHLDFFEYSLLSVDETLNRVIELTRNDLLSLIEITMFFLTIPSVIQLILSII